MGSVHLTSSFLQQARIKRVSVLTDMQYVRRIPYIVCHDNITSLLLSYGLLKSSSIISELQILSIEQLISAAASSRLETPEMISWP